MPVLLKKSANLSEKLFVKIFKLSVPDLVHPDYVNKKSPQRGVFAGLERLAPYA